MVRFPREKLQAGYHRRKDEQMQMKSGKKLHLASLNALGIKDEFLSYISAVGYKWLLELDDSKIPANLALEFFTSFIFMHNSTDPDEKSISFRVYDRTLFLSLNEWLVRLGLYTAQEATVGAWGDRDLGLQRVNAGFKDQEAWRSLTHEKSGRFKPSQSKGVHFTDHTLHFAQVYLSHNLSGQSNSVSTITTADLYLICCMRNSVKAHLGFWIAYACGQIASHPNRHLTACHILGVFIRRNLSVVMAEDASPFTMVLPLALFDLKFFANTHLIKAGGSEPQLYEVGTSEWAAKKREEEMEDELLPYQLSDLQGLVEAFAKVAEQQEAAMLRHEEQMKVVLQMMQEIIKHCGPSRRIDVVTPRPH